MRFLIPPIFLKTPSMAQVYIGLGSNIGDKRKNITNATVLIGALMGDLKVLSSLYETSPWGFESENQFLNAAILVETDQTPETCLAMAKAIEREMGRVKTGEGYEDRIIDVDILLYEDMVLSTESLTIPHPLMQQRDFVLRPLAEIAPNLLHPTLKKTMAELLSELKQTEKQ